MDYSECYGEEPIITQWEYFISLKMNLETVYRQMSWSNFSAAAIPKICLPKSYTCVRVSPLISHRNSNYKMYRIELKYFKMQPEGKNNFTVDTQHKALRSITLFSLAKHSLQAQPCLFLCSKKPVPMPKLSDFWGLYAKHLWTLVS